MRHPTPPNPQCNTMWLLKEATKKVNGFHSPRSEWRQLTVFPMRGRSASTWRLQPSALCVTRRQAGTSTMTTENTQDPPRKITAGKIELPGLFHQGNSANNLSKNSNKLLKVCL